MVACDKEETLDDTLQGHSDAVMTSTCASAFNRDRAEKKAVMERCFEQNHCPGAGTVIVCWLRKGLQLNIG